MRFTCITMIKRVHQTLILNTPNIDRTFASSSNDHIIIFCYDNPSNPDYIFNSERGRITCRGIIKGLNTIQITQRPYFHTIIFPSSHQHPTFFRKFHRRNDIFMRFVKSLRGSFFCIPNVQFLVKSSTDYCVVIFFDDSFGNSAWRK